jgi:phosphoglycolate phosphatase
MLTIVFDLDGTLIDTAADLIDTLNVVLTGERLPAMPFATARELIGGGAKRMIERALAAEGRACAPADIDRLYATFIVHYADHLADRSRPYPKLDAALDALEAAGYRLAVCTNKLEWLSVRLLNILKLAPRFAAICGPDTFGVYKPDPEMLRRTVRRADGRHHGRRFQDRRVDRPRRRRADRGSRFRLQRYPDRGPETGPHHQLVRRPAVGRHRLGRRALRACQVLDGEAHWLPRPVAEIRINHFC